MHFKCVPSSHLFQMLNLMNNWYLGQSDVNRIILLVETQLYISSLSLWCLLAMLLLLLVLFYVISFCQWAVCHYKSDASAKHKRHQILTVSSAPLTILHETNILLFPISVSRSILATILWRCGLIPALSHWSSWFKLGPHFTFTHTLSHTCSHTKKD